MKVLCIIGPFLLPDGSHIIVEVEVLTFCDVSAHYDPQGPKIQFLDDARMYVCAKVNRWN